MQCIVHSVSLQEDQNPLYNVTGRVLMKIWPGKEAFADVYTCVHEYIYERKRDRETQEEYTRHLRGGRP